MNAGPIRSATAGLLALVAAGATRLTAQQTPVFRATTALVTVDAIVRRGNVLVSGLSSTDFVLTDNGVAQTIEAAAVESVPLDLTLVLDASASTDGTTIGEFESDIRNIVKLLRPDDRVRLLVCADQVREVFPFRPPVGGVSFDGVHSSGSTSLLDGILFGLPRVPNPERQHLIVAFTDGGESTSIITGAMLIEAAARSGAMLRIVVSASAAQWQYRLWCRDSPDDIWRTKDCSPSTPPPDEFQTRDVFRNTNASRWWTDPPRENESTSPPRRPGQPSLPFLPTLLAAAEATGGQIDEAIAPPMLSKLFRNMLDDFRHSYVLRYSPAGVAAAGWHDVVVTVPAHADFEVTARKKYFGG